MYNQRGEKIDKSYYGEEKQKDISKKMRKQVGKTFLLYNWRSENTDRKRLLNM